MKTRKFATGRAGGDDSTLEPARQDFVAEVSARLGRAGSSTVVVGESGIGKTALLHRALARADGGLRVLFAQGVRGTVPTAYLGVHELLAEVDVATLGLADGQRSSIEAVLGRVAPGRDIPPAAVLMAVHNVIRALAGQGPLAVVVDDLEGMDPESAEIVEYLASRRYAPDAAPALLVVRRDAASHLSANTDVFTVPPLGRAGLQALVHGRLGRTLTPSQADRLLERTGGNPMWALELAQRGDDDSLPPGTLGQAMRARVERAEEPSRRIVQMLALVGAASADQIVRVLPVADGDISDAVDDDLIQERDGRLRVHPALGAAALDLLRDRERKLLHRRIAGVIDDPIARAGHLDRSTSAGPDAGVAAMLADAAAGARSVGAVHEALDLAIRATRRTPDGDEDAVRRRITWAEIAYTAGDYAGVLDALDDVDVTALAVNELDRALPLMVTAATAARGEAAARAMLRAVVVPTDDPVRQAIFDTYLAEANEAPEANSSLAVHALNVLRSTDAAPVTRHRAVGALILADVDSGRGIDFERIRESEALEPHIDLLAVNDSAAAQVGLYAHQTGDLATSRAALESVYATASEAGQEVIAGIFALHLATVELHAGHRARADQWLSIWEAVDPWLGTPPPSAIVAYGLRALRDDDDEAVRRLVDAPHGPGAEGMGRLVRLVLTGMASASARSCEVAVSELVAARALAISMGVREPGRRMWLDFSLATALVAAGDGAGALEIADQLATFSDGHRPLLDGVAERTRGQVAAMKGEWEPAVAHFRAAVAHLMRAGYPSELATAQWELARALHEQRARPEALRAIDSAAALAASASDARLVALVAADRERIDTSTVDAGLTARERVVALAAAGGATNREIAAEQHLSIRTVESQLSSAYRKLGVRSRSQLVAILHDLV